MKKNRRSNCPINFGLEIFGDSWTLLVIRDLLFLGKQTYGEFQSSPEGIATNILADRLNKLEKIGIVTKNKDPQNSKKFIYSLTKKGIDLLPIMLEIIAWGAQYDPQTGAPKAFIKRLKTDRENLTKDIIAALKNKAKKVV